MTRKLKSSKSKARSKAKGGAVTESQWLQFARSHNFNTYTPKTPAEIKEYNDMIQYQQQDIKQAESFQSTNPTAYNKWHQDYTDGYNKAIDEYGNDPDKLWNGEQKVLKPTANGNYIDYSAYPEDAKYAYSGYEQGWNDSLANLWKTIPRPVHEDKNWADYFVQGFTLPFTIAKDIIG